MPESVFKNTAESLIVSSAPKMSTHCSNNASNKTDNSNSTVQRRPVNNISEVRLTFSDSCGLTEQSKSKSVNNKINA